MKIPVVERQQDFLFDTGFSNSLACRQAGIELSLRRSVDLSNHY